MVVRLDEGPVAVRAYVGDRAARGRDHVVALVRQSRDAMAAASAGLTDEEASFQPGPDEFSMAQVLQHLNTSMERSVARIQSLSSGTPSTYVGPPGRPGGLPEQALESFAATRQYFLDGTDAVLAVLEAADPGAGIERTANHGEYGPWNWLEWGVYSHHVHTSDHIGQAQALRAEIEGRRH